MKKSKLAVARGAMHDARHAENTLRANYREAKKAANEFRREAMELCAEKEAWIYELSKLIKQRDTMLSALDGLLDDTIKAHNSGYGTLGANHVRRTCEAAIASVKEQA